MQKVSMVSDRKLANAVGGKTARPCDNCVRKRARWYCAADDAFLCEGCDDSVHSANPLASRHERVRLKTASLKPSKEASLEASMPSWHHSFTRKARTPRQKKHGKAKFEEATANNPLHIVPEICSDETSHGENEEQLLYRVPVFDPFVAELCTSANSNDAVNTIINDVEITDGVGNESKAMLYDMNNQLNGSLPSDMDLAQFAADVEILLGKGLDDDSFHMEGLGLINCQENDLVECSMGSGKVKLEDDDEAAEQVVMAAQDFDIEIDVTREPFDLNFDDNSLVTCEEDGEAQAQQIIMQGCEDDDDVKKKVRKILLRLDYDGIISAWADQRSPWTNGERPELDSYECWPYCMGTCGTIHHYGDGGLLMGHTPMVDGGREARVSRYREKRRTRLFSKKIRYEVRKLNAEKRPRMKGRFVKRANFAASSNFPLLNK